MAISKSNSRSGERGSSSTFIIRWSLMIGFCLIAIWVFIAPAPVSEQSLDANDPTELVDKLIDRMAKVKTSTESSMIPVTGEFEEHAALREMADTPGLGETGLIPDTTPTQAKLIEDKEEKNHTDFGLLITQLKEKNSVASETPVVETKTSTDSKIVAAEEGNTTRTWKLCKFIGAQDFIPCLDNEAAIFQLKFRNHYEHRERHCPSDEDLPKCLLPLPAGYKVPINWPTSRDQIWLTNVPHTQLVSYKADQNWVKLSPNRQKLLFPGGGTQFKLGARHYIDFLQKVVPEIAWGKHTRVILDVGCGVASFGGYLFDKDVLAMSIAPKDEHEAQVQMALERGIPAVSAVMGSQRLVFPSNVFDAIHCARCRVPWYMDDGILLLELNRVLRPGGFFLWSATPVYLKDEDNVRIWRETIAVIERMSWKLVAKRNDPTTKIGVAVFQKPKDNGAYNLREPDASPPICAPNDNIDAVWYVPLKACIPEISTSDDAREKTWPADWPLRLQATPTWLSATKMGIYGKNVAEDYQSDTEHWKRIIAKSYLQGVGIKWNSIRNVMDMKAGYGGFAAALVSHPVWVMNIIPVTEPDTLPIIYDRGLIGMYHDWCEPHSTYPRSYDLMHADHLFSSLQQNTVNLIQEMDRILRPDGWAIFRDSAEVLPGVEEIIKSLHWDIVLSYTQDQQKLLVVQKRFWRPEIESPN